VRVYALTSSQSPRETLDVFLNRERAESELREILVDEPSWVDVLSVVPIELELRRAAERTSSLLLDAAQRRVHASRQPGRRGCELEGAQGRRERVLRRSPADSHGGGKAEGPWACESRTLVLSEGDETTRRGL
jgi:hypothetical protein